MCAGSLGDIHRRLRRAELGEIRWHIKRKVPKLHRPNSVRPSGNFEPLSDGHRDSYTYKLSVTS